MKSTDVRSILEMNKDGRTEIYILRVYSHYSVVGSSSSRRSSNYNDHSNDNGTGNGNSSGASGGGVGGDGGNNSNS